SGGCRFANSRWRQRESALCPSGERLKTRGEYVNSNKRAGVNKLLKVVPSCQIAPSDGRFPAIRRGEALAAHDPALGGPTRRFVKFRARTACGHRLGSAARAVERQETPRFRTPSGELSSPSLTYSGSKSGASRATARRGAGCARAIALGP